MLNLLRNRAVLLGLTVGAISTLVVLGCGGSPGGDAINRQLRGIPGLNTPEARRAEQAAQLGAKGLDVADLDSGRRQDEIGQSVAIAITNRHKLSTDQALNDYVNLVGLTVASVAPNPEINYAFGVLDTSEVAAYSSPGGYVFITRGALKMIEDESELAGVLAHEVAHVALHHGIEAVKRAKQTDLALSAARTANEQFAQYSREVDVAADAVLVKGYNRSQESQADREAVQYLAASGYDPAGLLRFLQRLQRLTGSGGGVQQLMSTHPGTADRMAQVQRQLAAVNVQGVTLKDRYLANTNAQ